MGSERIKEIVLSLRNFSRSDEQGSKSVNIHEALEDTLLILKHRLAKGTERPAITVGKNYGTLPSVECYPGLLKQAVYESFG